MPEYLIFLSYLTLSFEKRSSYIMTYFEQLLMHMCKVIRVTVRFQNGHGPTGVLMKHKCDDLNCK